MEFLKLFLIKKFPEGFDFKMQGIPINNNIEFQWGEAKPNNIETPNRNHNEESLNIIARQVKNVTDRLMVVEKEIDNLRKGIKILLEVKDDKNKQVK